MCVRTPLYEYSLLKYSAPTVRCLVVTYGAGKTVTVERRGQPASKVELRLAITALVPHVNKQNAESLTVRVALHASLKEGGGWRTQAVVAH